MSTSSPTLPSLPPSSTSTPIVASGNTSTTAYHGIHPNGYIITLSVLGGIALLCILALIVFWLTRRRRRNDRHESFWHNWHLKAYSRVDTQTSTSSTSKNKEFSPEMGQRGYDYDDKYNPDVGDDDAEMAGAGDKGRRASIMDWWYGRRKSVLKMVEEGFEIDSSSSLMKKKQKQKSGTVHKVKRSKPSQNFEIDSDVRLSIADLSLTPSRTR